MAHLQCRSGLFWFGQSTQRFSLPEHCLMGAMGVGSLPSRSAADNVIPEKNGLPPRKLHAHRVVCALGDPWLLTFASELAKPVQKAC